MPPTKKIDSVRITFHLVNIISPLSLFIGFWYYDAMYSHLPTTALERSFDSFGRVVAYGVALGIGGILWFLTSRYGQSRRSLFIGSIIPAAIITIVTGSFISELLY